MSTPPRPDTSALDEFDNKWGFVIGVLFVLLAATRRLERAAAGSGTARGPCDGMVGVAYPASSARAPGIAPDGLFPRSVWCVALSVAPVLLLGLLTALGWRHFVTGMDAGGVVTIPKAPAVLVVCMVTVLGMLELTLAEWWSYVRVSSTGEAAEAALPPVWWTGLSTRVPSAATFVPVPYARSH